MKILVEAMCAEFGGIRTYVEHALAAWAEHEPSDELHVIVAQGSTLPTAGHRRYEVGIGRPAWLGRPWAQTRSVRRLVRRIKPDVVLSTLPSTTLLRPGVPVGVVIYDLRHELRPEQFSIWRRILRRISYARGYAVADVFISISHRSLDDLRALHPATRHVPGVVAHLGADHVARWPRSDQVGPCIAFAHHSNKNVDLLIDGWSELASRGSDVPRLTMLGVSGARRSVLHETLARRGLTPWVSLAPFLPNNEFEQVMASARMVVFPTDFEGFGLPVVEAMALSIPVVIGPERATCEVAGGHATVMRDWSAEALADAVIIAGDRTADQTTAALRHAEQFTWRATVQQTRRALADACRVEPSRLPPSS